MLILCRRRVGGGRDSGWCAYYFAAELRNGERKLGGGGRWRQWRWVGESWGPRRKGPGRNAVNVDAPTTSASGVCLNSGQRHSYRAALVPSRKDFQLFPWPLVKGNTSSDDMFAMRKPGLGYVQFWITTLPGPLRGTFLPFSGYLHLGHWSSLRTGMDKFNTPCLSPSAAPVGLWGPSGCLVSKMKAKISTHATCVGLSCFLKPTGSETTGSVASGRKQSWLSHRRELSGPEWRLWTSDPQKLCRPVRPGTNNSYHA